MKGQRMTAVMILLLVPVVPHLAVVVPDFSLQTPAPLIYGSPSVDTPEMLNITALNGFSGNVALSLSPSAGLIASLVPYCYCINLNSTSTSGAAQVLMVTSSVGTYTLNVTGTHGSTVHQLSITYKVITYPAGDFSLYVQFPASIIRGSTENADVFASGISSFGSTGPQTVTFAAGVVPRGLILTLSLATFVTQYSTEFGPTVSVTAPSTTPLGQYTIFVSATNGTIVHLSVAQISVRTDFAISAPNTLNVAPGTPSTSVITVTGLGDYEGTLTLSATYDTDHLTVSFSPSTLTLSATAISATSTISISTAAATPTSNYKLVVSATDGVITKSTTITVIATGLDFSISATPSYLTFQQGTAGSKTTMISLTSLNGFSGRVNMTTSGTSYFKPYAGELALAPTSISILLSPGMTQEFPLTVSVGTAALPGPYQVIVAGIASIGTTPIARSMVVPATVGPDFTMSVSTTHIIVHQGTVAPYTVTFTSLNGFSGNLRLLAELLSALPADPRTFFFPTYPFLSPGGTNTTEFVVGADSLTRLGDHQTFLAADADAIVGSSYSGHGIPMVITVEGPVTGPDFTISARPSQVDVGLGETKTTTIALSSLGGFSGTLTLHADSYELNTKLDPTQATITSTSSATATLSITAPAPTLPVDGYPLWYGVSGWGSLFVIATNSTGYSHWIMINETVTPFKLVPDPTRLDMQTGSSATSEITATGLNGFNQTLTLSTIVLPPGPTAILSTQFLNFSGAPNSAQVSLTLHVPATTQAQDYVVDVTATYMFFQWYCRCDYEQMNYTAQLLIHTVPSTNPGPSGGQNPPPPSSEPFWMFGLPPAQFYATVAALVIALGATISLLRLRRRRIVPSG